MAARSWWVRRRSMVTSPSRRSPNFLARMRQQVGEAHLGLAGQEALDQLLVLHQAQLEERHDLERHPRLLADGPLDEDLGHLRHPALRDGLGVRPLAGLAREGQVPEDVPGLEQPQRRLLAAGVRPEELHYAGDQHVERVAVLALAVDGVPGPVGPRRRWRCPCRPGAPGAPGTPPPGACVYSGREGSISRVVPSLRT